MSSVDLNNIFKYDKIVMNLNNQNCLSTNPSETCFYVDLVEPIKNIVFVKILRASIITTSAINAPPLLYKKNDPIHLSINDYDRSLSYLKSIQISTSTNILKGLISNLFQTTGVNIDKPILNSMNNGVAQTETITQNEDNSVLILYDNTITVSGEVLRENSKFINIFSQQTPLSTRFMMFSHTDYIIYYKANRPNERRFVKSVEVIIENVASPSTPENNTVTIAVKVEGSVDGITWNDLGNLTTNLMTYTTNDWGTSSRRKVTFDVDVTTPYEYNKIYFIPTGFSSPEEMKTKIKFLKIDLITYALLNTSGEVFNTVKYFDIIPYSTDTFSEILYSQASFDWSDPSVYILNPPEPNLRRLNIELRNKTFKPFDTAILTNFNLSICVYYIKNRV
jgi:hypothetical protein